MPAFSRQLIKGTIVMILVVACTVPINALALTLAARISDQSTEVAAGDRLYFEVEVKYPENPRRRDLRVEYQVVEDGEVVASEKVLRAVETQASFLDYIVVPKNTKGGVKTLNVIIETYESAEEGGFRHEVSATFKVNKGVDQLTLYFMIILGAILLVATLVIIQIRATKRRA